MTDFTQGATKRRRLRISIGALASGALIAGLLSLPSAANAEPTPLIDAQGFTFNINTDDTTPTATLLSPPTIEWDDDIEIPGEFEHEGVTYKVTVIGESAFQSKLLRSVIIPSSVVEIGEFAFANTRISHIDLPASLQKLGESVFAGTPLEEIVIPDGITEIPDGAFSQGSKLQSVTLPSTVTRIGSYAFYRQSFTEVALPNGLQEIGTHAFADSALTEVNIPAGVNVIEDYTFWNSNLTSAILPEGMKTIKEAAFMGNNITQFRIPSSVTTIGDRAFSDNSLTSIAIPDSATSLGTEAFSYNPDLTDVVLPTSITVIPDSLFANTNLTHLELPNTVISIGYEAFYGCHLEELRIPASVQNIADRAFLHQKRPQISGRPANGAMKAPVQPNEPPTWEMNVYFEGDAPSFVDAGYEPGSFGFASGKMLYYRASNSGFQTPTMQGYDTTPIYVATVNNGNGDPLISFDVYGGSLISKPTTPTRAQHEFTGWFNEANFEEYDFAAPVNSDIAIFAGWKYVGTTVIDPGTVAPGTGEGGKGLVNTGGENLAPFGIGGAALLLAGGAFLLARRGRRASH
ncbi:leucine-rich repeat protein [Leucobacter sp. UT-8R-CII-1-4]|uniref:leucine-rich repeat protein n=1 Tax=Leucobacter sp. UT-8R-CII-1-4 TaxID=3040075 RepID=UPI0024A7DF6C|nr:leucine-rich repeat protein [Leucobacter sp. UT-8R-CII-1-4]MDI6024514.1 leucine-rich repeat protein [Leucobacter sp. UT-8R-CII-1-4]